MSFIDDIANKALGMAGLGNSAAGAALQLLHNYPGGFSGLLQTFHEKGLGEVASSWVGAGPNQSISAEQIQNVLGEEHIRQFAARTGISADQASQKLAEYLPLVVDRLTPNGEVPSGNLLVLSKEVLRSFGNKAA